jgi:hypothetical protein
MKNILRLAAPQGRAGNDMSCATCGKRLSPKRGSRRMRFCSDACRQSAFRAKKWSRRYEGPKALRSVQNSFVESGLCKDHFGDRRSDIHGPRTIVERELFDGLVWRPTVSPDGVPTAVSRLGIARTPENGIPQAIQPGPRSDGIEHLIEHRDGRKSLHPPNAQANPAVSSPNRPESEQAYLKVSTNFALGRRGGQ